ncbi:uncharacterized protein LOC143878423 [Tasmannia lanceolata]|uniref:uncharacterized protein LOC143878423 n=1 Tax=Tasmannia lanceolata TaxID=3420 RepID=UPI004062EBD3
MELEPDRELQNGEIETVCSLCGDFGFRNALILCRKCGFRHQHTYCSRLYPNIDMKNWSCEWCLHEEEKQASKRSKVFEFLLEIAQSFPEKSPSGKDEKRICRRADRFSPEEKRFTEGSREIGSDARYKNSLKKSVRYVEKNKALDRWRNLAKSKLGCRRYKLLADVLC